MWQTWLPNNESLHFIGTFPPSLQCIVGRSWRGFPCAACAGAADQSRWSARRSQLLVELSTVCHKASQILNLASGFSTRRFSLVTCRWLPDQAVATSRVLSVHSIYVCVPQIRLAIGCTRRIQLWHFQRRKTQRLCWDEKGVDRCPQFVSREISAVWSQPYFHYKEMVL